jgi:2-polyprenyl-3-methyl-5-hydroxy-6-metoxy-1,4-benzoquinol methylase
MKSSKVLEVGCGNGEFLDRLKTELSADILGLELNENTIEIKNYILNETIETHSKKFPETYDIVCSFQVMEHIANIKTFIESQLVVLKRGGKLIVSVPNNDSFIKLGINILNMPPHHNGLWNKDSLFALQKLFPLKLTNIIYEPLQSYHTNYFIKTTVAYLKKKYHLPIFLLNYFSQYLKYLSTKSFQAFTIQAIYTKI